MCTPEEYFLGKKPNVAHFMIFGSSVYYHITKDAWKNLEPIADLGIFLVYTETPHNYRVYMSSNRMTVVRRYVKFDEEKIMICYLERELQLHENEDILAPKEEPRDDVEKPHVEEQGVETLTHAESSKYGRIAQKRLTCYFMMLERTWEHPNHSAGKGSH